MSNDYSHGNNSLECCVLSGGHSSYGHDNGHNHSHSYNNNHDNNPG